MTGKLLDVPTLVAAASVRLTDKTPDRKHVLVPAGDLATYRCATNPGQWMVPCHNVYHLEAGMMTRLSYTS